MADNEPRDASGNSLRQPAADAGWAGWQKWGAEVNRTLQAKADATEVDARIRDVVKGAADAVGTLAARLKELRTDVDKLKAEYNLMAWIGTTEQRLAQLETRTPHPVAGAVTTGEVAQLKRKLHDALGGAMAELAQQRLGAEQSAANGRAGNMPGLRGEARGEVDQP